MNNKKIKLMRTKALIIGMYGLMGASLFSGCNNPKQPESGKDTTIEEPTTEITTEETTEITTEEVNNDIVETIIEKYNDISDEKITRSDVGKIEVGQANLFKENGEYVFDPSVAYNLSDELIDKDDTKGIVTYINRKNKKAIASIGYIDGNLNSIYVKKYFDSENGYIETDPEKYILDINTAEYKSEVDYYNNVVTYTKKNN